MADIFLVIPAYRESLRLPPYLRELIEVLAPAKFTTEILVVDDGSPLDEHQRLTGALTLGSFGACRVLPPVLLPANRGKGYTILQGWRAARDAHWLAFVDADGAVPAYEVQRLLEMAAAGTHSDRPALWAPRMRTLETKIHRTLGRRLLGRIFARFASQWTGLSIYDTQCGFKVIPLGYYQRIEPLLQEDRFCFDIELLLALRHVGATVQEIPIDWHDVPGGQLHPIRDGLAMLGRLFAIRNRARHWPPST
jgi:dolichyl-phosphate beta-glucosyltransferase